MKTTLKNIFIITYTRKSGKLLNREVVYNKFLEFPGNDD